MTGAIAKYALALFVCVTFGAANGAAPGTPADRALAKLKAVGDSPNYYWAWTYAWSNLYDPAGDWRFARAEANGRFSPMPTGDVRLASGYQKYSGGRRPVIDYSDLAGVAGTWHTTTYYMANRASLTAVIRRQWREFGGLMVFSWHMDHPACTNGFPARAYRFKTEGADRNVIGQILSGAGGPCGTGLMNGAPFRRPFPNPRAWYMAALKDVADFFNGLVDEETGEKIPVVMRYPHEMDGSWFWWGRDRCSPGEFRAFCRMTADYLRSACGDGQILFAYTPDRTWKDLGAEGDAANTFLSRYPGDDYVDVVGFDDYSIGHGDDREVEVRLSETVRKLRIVSDFAVAHGKAAALTETGGLKKRDDFWVCIHRAATAPGVRCAFVDTWGRAYGMIPETAAGERDQLAFAARPEVLMADSPGAGFRPRAAEAPSATRSSRQDNGVKAEGK